VISAGFRVLLSPKYSVHLKVTDKRKPTRSEQGIAAKACGSMSSRNNAVLDVLVFAYG